MLFVLSVTWNKRALKPKKKIDTLGVKLRRSDLVTTKQQFLKIRLSFEFDFCYQGLILLMRQDVNCVDPEGRLYFLHLHTTKIYDLYKVHVLARHPMSYLGPKMR